MIIEKQKLCSDALFVCLFVCNTAMCLLCQFTICKVIFSERHLISHVDCARVKLKFESMHVTDSKEINCWNQTTSDSITLT